MSKTHDEDAIVLYHKALSVISLASIYSDASITEVIRRLEDEKRRCVVDSEDWLSLDHMQRIMRLGLGV